MLCLQSAGLENLQEELKIPNHRVPLSAHGVQQSHAAGQQVRQLLHAAKTQNAQQQDICHSDPTANVGNGKLFMYTSPFLRCIQTAQHMTRALDDDQVCHCYQWWLIESNQQKPGQENAHYHWLLLSS